jgi:leader peptidase (prepilin peptidase) / N-methyltransferase
VKDSAHTLAIPANALAIIVFIAASAAGALLLNWINAAFGTLLVALVLFVTVTDLDRFEIPDIANFAILVLGLAWTSTTSEFGATTLIEAITRSLLCSAVFLVVSASYQALRHIEGLGLGDVKLAGAGASWLCSSYLVVALLVAVGAVFMLIVMRRLIAKERIQANAPIPFGAFLAPAIWIVWFMQVRGI